MPSAVTGGRYEHSVAGRGSPQTGAEPGQAGTCKPPAGARAHLSGRSWGRDGARVRRLPECWAQERRWKQVERGKAPSKSEKIGQSSIAGCSKWVMKSISTVTINIFNKGI